MTAFVPRRLSYSVGWRLTLGLLPTLLAVVMVVGLFYYGEIGRSAPRIVLAVASLLALLSLVITFRNARYFVERIGRLARVTGGQGASRQDEFDRIEQVVGTLGTALSEAEAERSRADAAAAAHLQDEATMLAGVVADTLSQLDEVRYPLHILLEAPFGDLNENQEELLRDARAAADAMDAALRRLALVADADRNALPVQAELVQINDVVRSVLPLARAAVERKGARVNAALEPGLPRVMADRAKLAGALSLLATQSAESVGPDVPLAVSTLRAATGPGAVIRLSPAPAAASNRQAAASVLAERLVSAQGGKLSVADGALELRVGGGPSA